MTTPSPAPTNDERERLRRARACFFQTLFLLGLGCLTLPIGWARSALESAKSNELNLADREETAGGYYQGLIDGGGQVDDREGAAVRHMIKPADWGRFHAANVTRPLPDGDFLQFDLKPNVDKVLFGHRFNTNSHGMRDREYSVEKPPGVFRIAVLGASMDMGWGIDTQDTYVNLLEDWLNAHAEKRGIARRFEVLNFAVAAYSPLQRLDTYRRKARQFSPDLVIYSATMLDVRLMEIHICDIFRGRSALVYDFLDRAVAEAGLTAEDRATDSQDRLLNKDSLKKKLRPFYWSIYDDALGTLAADCRSDGAPLVCLIVPRVGKADAPRERAEPVARLRGIAAHHAVPVYDLTDTFDGQDPTLFEIAPWDDHPNALGHRRLFLAICRALVNDPALYPRVFAEPRDDAARAPASE